MDLKAFYRHQKQGFALRKALFAVYVVAVAVYFGWRVTTMNLDHPVFSAIFFAAEIATLVLALMSVLILWRVKERAPTTARDGLSVDVLVPTLNEQLPLVRRTVIAAMHIAYPHETWLLDDGDRPEMKELADSLGCHYLRRDTNRGAKPGNLNNALQYCKADFIAVIDCDHIAQRDYLDRLLGYFDDPQVAFVQAPQDYYNTNAFQYRNNARLGLLWHDQTGFFATGQAGRDFRNATTCCGTSTIVRRSVIDEIGGFPEETVTEDIHVAIKAQKLGYKSVYYPLPLAYGVAPVDLGEFQKQRLRWGQGNVQSIREEGLPLTRRLSFAQNAGYTYLGFLYAEGWARLVFYLTPPTVIFTGMMPIAPTHDFLWFFVPFFCIALLFFEELGRGHQRFHVNEQMAMARFPVFIASTFAVFRKRIKWRVSSKEFVGHFQVYLLAPQLAVLALNLCAAIWAIAVPDEALIEAYSLGMLVFGVMWCAFNCWLAASVIANAVRCAKNKRADYRFALKLPLQVSVDGGAASYASTIRLSATGMSFAVDAAAGVTDRSVLEGEIYVPGMAIPFRAAIEPGHPVEPSPDGEHHVVRCQFTWHDQNLIDRLDMSLHACVWHRRLVWDGEYFLTPLERLATFVGLMRDGRSQMKDHKAILYRRSDDGASPVKLALMLPGQSGCDVTLVAFEPLEPLQRLSVVWAGGGAETGQHLTVEQCTRPGETASAGPNDVSMYTFGAGRTAQTNKAVSQQPAPSACTAEPMPLNETAR